MGVYVYVSRFLGCVNMNLLDWIGSDRIDLISYLIVYILLLFWWFILLSRLLLLLLLLLSKIFLHFNFIVLSYNIISYHHSIILYPLYSPYPFRSPDPSIHFPNHKLRIGALVKAQRIWLYLYTECYV